MLLSRVQTQLDQERELHEATKAELSALTAGASQNAMLDLELADYQRTVDSLNAFDFYNTSSHQCGVM